MSAKLEGLRDMVQFLPQLERLLEDDSVSEIMHNPDGKVWYERHGRIYWDVDTELPQDRLILSIQNAARELSGDDLNEKNPILDTSLPDGSRVNAIVPPVVQPGLSLNIRRYNAHKYTLEELVACGSVTAEVAVLVPNLMRENNNVLISGGTSTGKTTFLNATLAMLDRTERLVLIEDTAEITVPHLNQVRLVAQKDTGITIRRLVQTAMRMRPDRLVLGEVRGEEAFELLNALNSGHGGSVATVHAESAHLALDKLASYVLMAGTRMPHEAIRKMLATHINVIVQLERNRKTGRRYVGQVLETWGQDEAGEYRFEVLYTHGPDSGAVSVEDMETAGPAGVRGYSQ